MKRRLWVVAALLSAAGEAATFDVMGWFVSATAATPTPFVFSLSQVSSQSGVATVFDRRRRS